MKVIRGSSGIKKPFKYPVITMGNFDGFHKGHGKILRKVISIAKKNHGTSVLYSFKPHPVKVLAPEVCPLLLQTAGQKALLLESTGLDVLIIEPFTKMLSKVSAENFFKKIIVNKIGAKEIVIGYDFTFGVHRTGSINDLTEFAEPLGIKIHTIDAFFHKDTLISSTHIRHFIRNGEMPIAKSMLGRPYSIEGIIIHGRGIGAEIGFHTANLSSQNELIPPPGVYITSTIIKKNGKKYKSITNIGYNPTFGGTDLSIETYIIGFRGNLLKQKIELQFHKKIRREITFESTENLRDQIEKDVKSARKYHENKSS